jgi:hypothetical protein
MDVENGFTPVIHYRVLSMRVLAVAMTRVEGTWAAYVDAVPGQNHDAEYHDVLESGTKLWEPWARAIFHEYKDLPYAD